MNAGKKNVQHNKNLLLLCFLCGPAPALGVGNTFASQEKSPMPGEIFSSSTSFRPQAKSA
jgi:hypothetical protein